MGRKKKAEQEVYHVEVITRARVSEDGDWEYYVKWAGYDSDADSWEPQENVKQCERLLSSFWKHVGIDDEDYSVGYEIAAQDYWIKEEKDFFAKQFAGEGSRKSENDSKKRKVKQEKTKTPEPKKVEIHVDSSEESDVPLGEISAGLKTATLQRKKRKKAFIGSSSDSDQSAGRPLKQQRKRELSNSRSRSHTADKEPSHPKTLAEPAEKPSRTLPPPPRPLTSSVPSPVLPPPPKIQFARTHQDQKSHPLVKPMGLPSQAVQSGSALATKQRIAAGSSSSAATKPKPLQQAHSKLLTGLSFKKKPHEAKDAVSAPDRLSHISLERKSSEKEASSMTDVQAPGPSTSGLPGVGAGSSSVTKQTMDEPFYPVFPLADPDVGMFEVDYNTAPPPPMPAVQEQLAKPVPPKRASEIAADEFLGSLNMPGLNSPLEPPVSDSTHEVDSFRPKALTSMKASAMPKIPKKWKWEGDLFIDFVENRAEKICEVTIKDPTDSRDGARMSSMMAQTDTIRIQNLYTVVDLTPVFRACGDVQQFARLEASENHDTRALYGLFRHMAYQRQMAKVAVFPLSLDGAELALLLMFSPSLDGLCSFLRVPDHLRQNSQNTKALVALLPWLVSSAKYTKGAKRKPVNETLQRILIPNSQPKDSRRRMLKGTLAMAMDLLSFSPELLDFMNLPNRSYCIWSFPADGTPAFPGFETRQLKYVLSKTNAASVSLDKEARAIFVHVGALETFYNFPALVAKRRDAPEVRFFTYGTHESVPSSRWGIREVLPLGGIVTFTPMAMAEDPCGCYALMLQLAQHPLWECYLMPSILGLSHALSCNKEKPTFEVLSMDSYLLPILDLVDAGSIAVMQSPLAGEDAWLRDFINMQGLEGQDLLQECIQSSIAHFAHCRESDVLVAADQDISRDLLNMELQPAFMDDYRRFVVIRGASEEHRSLPEGGSGLEWSSVSKFQFGDDFFPILGEIS
ncbi:hypothetical protein K503DRAFT_795147 [Rhizopogon vinicolor AM-OR11-026]|uniref:Chromo domain-containing protein n=1 Tax=Rhizopogon vinicolor AM-OR11-026 TaxID=1314800 RepID=A0A1B7NJH8_9AGAM|nr:hypothetical protein K503DRAFT_795147 [Rhizopogon vinicolor AM-OR11-026]